MNAIHTEFTSDSAALMYEADELASQILRESEDITVRVSSENLQNRFYRDSMHRLLEDWLNNTTSQHFTLQK